MNKTNIEYMDYSWNPLAMRCTPISEGCSNCWHIKMADRLAKIPTIAGYYQKAYRGESPPILIKERLSDPLNRKKPSIIGVQFMGDLFHDDIADHEINSVFLTMVNADWHTYLILTKRPERMADFVSIGTGWRGMMPHVLLGVTVESDKYLWRIEQLLKILAAKRFVSIEPMLGPVDLAGDDGGQPYFPFDNEEGTVTPGLDWVIAGCESGPKRRPAYAQWFRELKNQCVDAGIPFFLKQAGGYINGKSTVVKLPELDGKIWNERP